MVVLIRRFGHKLVKQDTKCPRAIQERLCAIETWETVEFGSIGNTFSCLDDKE
jgi:hypothetical protein